MTHDIPSQSRSTSAMFLNSRAARLCDTLVERQAELRVALHDDGVSPPVVDCGVQVPGSLEAGQVLAEICMAGLGRVTLAASAKWFPFAQLSVQTDQPLAACLLSQYAGWRIEQEDFFGMGSGPMRSAAQVEALYQSFPCLNNTGKAVGVLEACQLPPAAVGLHLADQCGVSPRQLSLLVAPTNSLAGIVQIVARSIETAMHKLHELKFDVACIVSGLGSAPLPPSGGPPLRAMGRANDAMLYGASVVLWCDCEDGLLAEIITQVPSCSSPDYGRPFAELFESCHHDFYQMDKLLFSPAAISMISMQSGRTFSAGQIDKSIVDSSFLSA